MPKVFLVIIGIACSIRDIVTLVDYVCDLFIALQSDEIEITKEILFERFSENFSSVQLSGIESIGVHIPASYKDGRNHRTVPLRGSLSIRSEQFAYVVSRAIFNHQKAFDENPIEYVGGETKLLESLRAGNPGHQLRDIVWENIVNKVDQRIPSDHALSIKP